MLGPLGLSVGWAIMVSVMDIAANTAGLLTGEWNGAGRKAYVFLLGGTITLLVAISVVGYLFRQTSGPDQDLLRY